MSHDPWRLFVEARRRVAAREREELERRPLPPQEAIHAALALLRLYGDLHGEPFRKDALTLREEEEVRRTWDRLREAWRRDS